MEKKRSSNIELFRIVCMFLIILSHFTIECGIEEYSTYNKLIDFFGYWGGGAGNIGFICISAWYLDRFNFSFQKIMNIILKATIYSMILYGVARIFFQYDFSVEKTLQSLLPLIYGGYQYITVFVIMYFISPMLKKCFNLLNRKLHKKLVIVSSISLTVIPLIFIGSTNFMNLFTTFILVYLVIDYVKRYNLLEVISFKRLMTMIGINVFIMVAYAICVLMFKNKIPFLQPYSSLWASSTGIFMIMTMASAFLLFVKWHIPYFKAINRLGSAVFGIFLLHAAPATRGFIWIEMFGCNKWGMDSLFCVKVLGACSVMFFVCAVIEVLIQKITNMLMKGNISQTYLVNCKKIDVWMNDLED